MPDSTVSPFQPSHSSDSYQLFFFFPPSSEHWEPLAWLIVGGWEKIKNRSPGFCLGSATSMPSILGPSLLFSPVKSRGRDSMIFAKLLEGTKLS